MEVIGLTIKAKILKMQQKMTSGQVKFAALNSKCQTCKGVGWIIEDDVAIDRCDCLKQQIQQNLLKNSMLNETFKHKKFQDYKPRNEKQEEMLQMAIDYTINYHEIKNYRSNGMALLGSVGIGKTHLLASITNELAFQGHKVLFIDTTSFIKELRDSIKQDNMSQHLEKVKNCEILILDDLAKEKVTEWVQEQYYYIINHRYNAGKPLLYSSNCTMAEIGKLLGDATASRLYAITKDRLVHVEDKDYRLIE